MKLPRDVSGKDLIQVLCKHLGYRKVSQVGSHVMLATLDPRQHRLAIPDHDPLRIGTLNGILRAVAEVKATTREDILRWL